MCQTFEQPEHSWSVISTVMLEGSCEPDTGSGLCSAGCPVGKKTPKISLQQLTLMILHSLTSYLKKQSVLGFMDFEFYGFWDLQFDSTMWWLSQRPQQLQSLEYCLATFIPSLAASP